MHFLDERDKKRKKKGGKDQNREGRIFTPEQIKEARRRPIEEIIARKHELVGGQHARYIRGAKRDSLVIDRRQNYYIWHSVPETGDAIDWLMRYENMTFPQAVSHLLGLPDLLSPRWRSPAPPATARDAPATPTTILDQELHKQYHAALSHAGRRWWQSRGITNETVDRCLLGEQKGSYTIPVVIDGFLYDIRHRNANPNSSFRYWPEAEGLGAHLYIPFPEVLQTQQIFWVSGEIKCLVCNQAGLPAITNTAGAESWFRSWTPNLAGKDIVLIFDPGEREQARRIHEKMTSDGLFVRDPLWLPLDVDDALLKGLITPTEIRRLIR